MPEVHRSRRARSTPPRYQAFLDGTLTVDDLDEEEIMRGQLRNVNGNFSGGRPLLVPQEFVKALMARQQDLIKREMAPMVLTALKTLNDVMEVKDFRSAVGINNGPRVAAAKLVLERVLGKVPDQIEMKAEIKQWEDVLDTVLVDVEDPEPEQKEIEQ